MAGADILKQAVDSAVGRLEKARIKIEDSRIKEIQVIDNDDDTSSLYNTALTDKLLGENNTNGLLGTGLTNEINILKSQMQEIVDRELNSSYKTYTVRFNPSELSINAAGGSMIARNGFEGDGKKAEHTDNSVNIQLNVKLVFDDMDINDSFMNENLNPLTPIRTVGKKIYNAATGNRNSVQAQVEGFIAALRNSYTRRVEFIWGTLSYKGVLNYINSEYTMFSIQGRPVRANVDIGILCSEPDDDSQWEDKYAQAFALGDDSTNMESVAQNFGNLLNINL